MQSRVRSGDTLIVSKVSCGQAGIPDKFVDDPTPELQLGILSTRLPRRIISGAAL
jgi:hypothetical protein